MKDRFLPSMKVHRWVGIEGRKSLANPLHKMRDTVVLKKYRPQRVYYLGISDLCHKTIQTILKVCV